VESLSAPAADSIREKWEKAFALRVADFREGTGFLLAPQPLLLRNCFEGRNETFIRVYT
jgi:hypothetical protein